MTAPLLRTIDPTGLDDRLRSPIDEDTLATVRPIVADVITDGETALRRHATELDGLNPADPLLVNNAALMDAVEQLDPDDRELLERVAERIRTFAEAQRGVLGDVELPVPGGTVGHRVAPVDRVGCYAPGGRHPLPSSVLMTVIPARVAGVREIIVASPRPAPITLAAAGIAGADALLTAGGAHAIAAMASGVVTSRCDMIVGPGNRYVTAAKYLLSDRVGIDMLAGPSELVVLADDTSDPRVITSDLIAQAEHDPDARAILIATDQTMIDAVNAELTEQLTSLPTSQVAREALSESFVILASTIDDAIDASDRIAPEHLAIHTCDARAVAARVKHYGGLFVGSASAEVLGDYAAGPNHTLPTGQASRYTGGLSVLDFLRVRTYVQIDDPHNAEPLIHDAERLARLEGLEGHARSASCRRERGDA